MEAFLDSNFFSYVILPILVFLARIMDVTIGTVRIILVAKGQKHISAFLGFIEVFFWLFAMGIIVQNLNNYVTFFAFAAGYATGNYVGIVLEEKLAMGNVIVQVITKEKAGDLLRILKAGKYRITHMQAKGNEGMVAVIYILVKRKNLDKLIALVKKTHPKSFFSIEDVRFVSEGMIPLKQSATRRNRRNFLKISRLGK